MGFCFEKVQVFFVVSPLVSLFTCEKFNAGLGQCWMVHTWEITKAVHLDALKSNWNWYMVLVNNEISNWYLVPGTWYLVPGRSCILNWYLVPVFNHSNILKLVLVPILNNVCIIKLVRVPVFNNFCILKLVLLPVLKNICIIQLVPGNSYSLKYNRYQYQTVAAQL